MKRFVHSIFLVVCAVAATVNSQGCFQPLGIQNGAIKNEQFSASSTKKYHYPHLARLNRNDGSRAWCAMNNDTKPWIKVTLNGTYRITKVAIQGRNHTYRGWFVTKFRVMYQNGKYLKVVPRSFQGPYLKNNIADVWLDTYDIVTSAIVIMPLRWYPANSMACLRMELYGCKTKEPTKPPSPDFCALNNTCEHICVNGIGRAICQCKPGFELHKDKKSCTDIDECKLGKDRCEVFTTDCVNTPGFYRCDCNHPGLEKRNHYYHKCFDKNECRYNNGGCNHKCYNYYKYYKCSCYDGYHMESDNHTCIDNDECKTNKHQCDNATTTCQNRQGDYMCPCLSGLKHETVHNCTDINECDTMNGGCDDVCTNTYRSYSCSCRKGTTLDADKHACNDIDECMLGQHNCSQICNNFYSGFSCDCSAGYKLADDKKTCVDVNECIANNGKGSCQYECKNTIGSYQCSCPSGFRLASDGKACLDVDECGTRQDNCDVGTSSCINTQGSFECRCNDGFQKNAVTGLCEAKKCPAIKSFPNGYLSPSDCSNNNAKQYKDVCTFKCHQGYELNEKSVKTAFCNSDGNWNLRGGYQAICQRIRCGNVSDVADGMLVPSSCHATGVKYGDQCQLFCNNGFSLQGRKAITCQKNGNYDHDFKKSKCIPRVPLNCPEDIKMVLPLGASHVSIPLSKFAGLDIQNLKSIPDGVLTGKHKFQSRIQSQAVKFLSGDESCVFHVTVTDREPPKVSNCPTEDIYVTVLGLKGAVSWPEPEFKDNVKVEKVIHNINNNEVLPAQVYFVYYAAKDTYGNEATCRFFVHVRARYCLKNEIPGGDGASMIWFPGGNNQLNVFLNCPPGKMFSFNVSGASIFRCNGGVWADVPDCVGYTMRNGTCPTGHRVVQDAATFQTRCAKCPKGTKYANGNCEKCPAGSYQDNEGSTQCVQCPAGTTSLREGVKDASACQAQCQPGGYSSTGLYGSSGCERCPEGSYQDLFGQRSCKLCPNGGRTFLGATSEDHCSLPARVSKIYPETEVISAFVDDTVVIKCYGTGSPSPFMQIKNVTELAPASFRGAARLQPLITGNKYISGMQLTIENVQTYDTAVYRCSADNRRGSQGGLDERDVIIEIAPKV